MFEPVQNCFTFYHSDGKSSAHIYSDQEDLLVQEENNCPIKYDTAQQNLGLPESVSDQQ